MTGEILDSDVEFTQRLLDEGRSDGDIVAALGLRRIERGNANRLLADLRSGRRIRPKMILLPRRSGQRKRRD
jgi:hypothetical protein